MRANPPCCTLSKSALKKTVESLGPPRNLSNPSAPVRIYPPSTSVKRTLARSFAASQSSFFLFSRFFLQVRPAL
jgi:hypothetical protein